MAQELSSKKFGKICGLTGREGDLFLVRKGRNNSRVVPMANPVGEGELVKTSDIVNPRDWEDPAVTAEKAAKAKAKEEEKAEKAEKEAAEKAVKEAAEKATPAEPVKA